MRATPTALRMLVETKAEALTLAILADMGRDAYDDERAVVVDALQALGLAASRAARRPDFKPVTLCIGGTALSIIRDAADTLADWGEEGADASDEERDALVAIIAALGKEPPAPATAP
jgi:hypothetical protein